MRLGYKQFIVLQDAKLRFQESIHPQITFLFKSQLLLICNKHNEVTTQLTSHKASVVLEILLFFFILTVYDYCYQLFLFALCVAVTFLPATKITLLVVIHEQFYIEYLQGNSGLPPIYGSFCRTCTYFYVQCDFIEQILLFCELMLNPTQFQAKEEKVPVANDSLSEADPLA